MIRFDQHSGMFANEKGVDDCYSLRYVMALLGRDEVDRAGEFLRQTCARANCAIRSSAGKDRRWSPSISSGGPCICRLTPRAMRNFFGRCEICWCKMAISTAMEGQRRCDCCLPHRGGGWPTDRPSDSKRAPTAFGEVSVVAHSRLGQNEIRVEVSAPRRAPKQSLLRIRPPKGWQVVGGAAAIRHSCPTARGTVDITGLRVSLQCDST